MSDTLTPLERSTRMSLVRGKDTGPELIVRRMIHAMGYRYRLHVKDLPGRPDLVFPRLSSVIFVHGCFWHRHKKKSCKLARMPKSRLEFWEGKLEGNRLRDLRNNQRLRRAGWRILQVWECELNNLETLASRIRYFLDNDLT